MPKGAVVTVCLIGDKINKAIVDRFLDHPEVRKCFPAAWKPPNDKTFCLCAPRVSLGSSSIQFGDHIVFTGDCGVTRLYKDGIGSAYRTARACATTLVFWGYSKDVLARHFQPVCDAIATDNRLGGRIFRLFELFRTTRFLNRAVLSVTQWEQEIPADQRLMSMTLWDMFSGTASYRSIFKRLLLSPKFLIRFALEILIALLGEMFLACQLFWRRIRRSKFLSDGCVT
ncbi:MAG: hypothetical protein HQL87_18910 [Magnetococcales bacterium]|nr:hypothetical protein [Magnetococcales bacterium]